MSNSITPTEKAQTMNLGGTMAFVQATLQRFNSEVIAPLIPAQASGNNQLADKAFVNSSIATATATYRGNYNLVSDLELTVSATEQQIVAALATAISTADNNDYCYVAVPTADDTPTEIARIDRYKHNGTAWALEYTLNNSGFTAAEWAAIQSGITSGLVAKLTALPTLAELTLLLAAKQDEIIDLSALGNGIGTCATAASTTEKAVTLQGYELKKNGFVAVSFDYDVPAGATMNINSKGAKAIVHKGAAIQADVIKAGDTAIFGYDGTNYVLVSSSSGDVSGTITVNLVPVVSGSQYAASLLNGVTVELWNVSDNKTVETKTWAGSQLSFTKVMAAKTYKLKFSQKYGYSTPQDSQEFVLGVGETYNVGTIEYTADKYVLNVSTNQSDHTDLASTVIRVSATGISADGYLDFTGAQTDVEVLVPKGTTPTAACSSGQPSANNYKQTITVVAATNPSDSTPTTGSITAIYETEILTVSITKDSGSGDMSTPTITVKNGNTTIGTLHNGDSLKIAYSINYVCTASQLDGYSAPASVTKNWANTTAKSLTFLYEEETGVVDLGLPSGTKWAIGNIIKVGSKYKIGAETDYGAYVSFGNVTPHFSANGSTFDDGYDWGTANTGPYASTPGAAISGAQTTGASYAANSGYDAARQLLGGKWRMPTAAECKELNDNCTSAWVTKNGVAGREFTSNINGAKVFFPAAGDGYGASLINRGSYGYYWSSSLISADYGYNLYFNSGGVNPQNNIYRYVGFSVRAVQ